MKRVLLIMLLVLGAISYGQNSKENRKLIREQILLYDVEIEGETTIPILGKDIKSLQVLAKEGDEDAPLVFGLLFLFYDNHYEFISVTDIKIMERLAKQNILSLEAFFYAFLDTEDHLGRSDRK